MLNSARLANLIVSTTIGEAVEIFQDEIHGWIDLQEGNSMAIMEDSSILLVNSEVASVSSFDCVLDLAIFWKLRREMFRIDFPNINLDHILEAPNE